jgi:hypothetical protein
MTTIGKLIELLSYYNKDSIITNEQGLPFTHIVNSKDSIVLSTQKPIAYCARSGGYVYPTTTEGYFGYSIDLDEDVYEIETEPLEVYYRVFDTQRGVYFATGYNAVSMEELIESFQSYILMASEIEFEHDKGTAEYEVELNNILGTWELIEEHLQGVTLEKSHVKFVEDDY